jgi:hypothetical protein
MKILQRNFSRQVFEKHIKFHENPSSAVRVVPCGRTDGRKDMREHKISFRNFGNAPTKAICSVSVCGSFLASSIPWCCAEDDSSPGTERSYRKNLHLSLNHTKLMWKHSWLDYGISCEVSTLSQDIQIVFTPDKSHQPYEPAAPSFADKMAIWWRPSCNPPPPLPHPNTDCSHRTSRSADSLNLRFAGNMAKD